MQIVKEKIISLNQRIMETVHKMKMLLMFTIVINVVDAIKNIKCLALTVEAQEYQRN